MYNQNTNESWEQCLIPIIKLKDIWKNTYWINAPKIIRCNIPKESTFFSKNEMILKIPIYYFKNGSLAHFICSVTTNWDGLIEKPH